MVYTYSGRPSSTTKRREPHLFERFDAAFENVEFTKQPFMHMCVGSIFVFTVTNTVPCNFPFTNNVQMKAFTGNFCICELCSLTVEFVLFILLSVMGQKTRGWKKVICENNLTLMLSAATMIYRRLIAPRPSPPSPMHTIWYKHTHMHSHTHICIFCSVLWILLIIRTKIFNCFGDESSCIAFNKK